MKNLRLLFLSGLLLLSILPSSISASNTTEPVTVPANVPAQTAQMQAYEARLAEIKAMDKSKLNASEKKQLRKELRSMKKAAVSGGVYLSVGALIIIVLLLLLLL
jgi:hypothetical protein